MKRILNKMIAFGSVALLVLPACKKSGEVVTSNGGKPGTLSATSTSLVLDKTKLNDPSAAITFSFTNANYGFSAAVTNTLQIDVPGDNWKNPTSATLSTKVTTQGYSTADFNNLILKLNVPAGVATPVQVRVMHSVSAEVAPIYSNVLDLTVTAFNLTSYVYVPGAYEGWANPGPQEDSLVSVTGNGVYVGIINFPAGQRDFLVLPVKGDWSHKYATTDGSTSDATNASYSVQLVTGGDNNFFAPTTAGQYLVTLNTNTNSLTIQQADFYTIIGSATPGGNWSTDMPLKFINDGNNNWVGTFSLLAGQFKFRQDSQWSNSWGIPKSGSAGFGVAGALNDTSNDNIDVTAGTHTVTFTMAPTTLGTPAQTLASYVLQ